MFLTARISEKKFDLFVLKCNYCKINDKIHEMGMSTNEKRLLI